MATTRKRLVMDGPLRSIGWKAGGAGVRVSVNGRDVARVDNHAPAATGQPQAESMSDEEMDAIRIGRWLDEQSKPITERTLIDNSSDDSNDNSPTTPTTPGAPPLPPGNPITTPSPAPSPLPRPRLT